VHAKFDALSPWIENLVDASLRKILGDIPDPVILHKIVTQAITQNRRELKYILRAGEDIYEAALELAKDLESTDFRGLILDVEVDRDLDAQSIILTSADGALDISLETQLNAVRAELASALGR
jgi:flagellar biosynthesis/type III secretory pathway protein FliH